MLNVHSGRWFAGPRCEIGFVPLQARIGLELTTPHPPTLPVVIRYTDRYGTDQEIPLHVPLPRLTAGQAVVQESAHRVHLPWRKHAADKE